MNWGTGQMHEDRNVKIIFNTFLKADDVRVDYEVLEQLAERDVAANTTQPPA
jgi:hypothetical protein